MKTTLVVIIACVWYFRFVLTELGHLDLLKNVRRQIVTRMKLSYKSNINYLVSFQITMLCPGCAVEC